MPTSEEAAADDAAAFAAGAFAVALAAFASLAVAFVFAGAAGAVDVAALLSPPSFSPQLHVRTLEALVLKVAAWRLVKGIRIVKLCMRLAARGR